MPLLLCFCSFNSRWHPAHQVLEECSNLSREHSQVQEACGDLVIILCQVTVP